MTKDERVIHFLAELCVRMSKELCPMKKGERCKGKDCPHYDSEFCQSKYPRLYAYIKLAEDCAVGFAMDDDPSLSSLAMACTMLCDSLVCCDCKLQYTNLCPYQGEKNQAKNKEWMAMAKRTNCYMSVIAGEK